MVGIPPVDALETIRDGLFIRFAEVAAGTLFVYDVLLNLDLELKYVWAALGLSLRRQRPIKIAPTMFNILYLVQRYLPLWDRLILDMYYMLGPSEANSCETTYKMSAWIMIIGVDLSECILGLRIWAVWLNSPFVLVMLVALTLSCAIPAIFFFVRFVRGIHCQFLYEEYFLQSHTHVSGYVRSRILYARHGTTSRMFLFGGSEQGPLPDLERLKVVTAGFIMMAIPGIKAYRRGGRSNLVKVIYQDGAIYYTSMFLVSLINIVVILHLPVTRLLTKDYTVHLISLLQAHQSTLAVMVAPLERVLHSIIASHIVLHLRKVAPRGYVQNWDAINGITTEEHTIQEHTEMSFVSNALRSDIELQN
ncbi:hypothetical protein E1B28_002845 [Marasmius oreades]|uniref:DUF6533 domain-containing protein n=1 Tax=Marasmius oreades TaxID=181124 RepID=A0A9P7UPC9_9AGAR|nr:uncharacterized protein E1B28_002845 [Marasmius oreades]KAG7086929.1 hypothetical protein E1B28_002845 [Marasmius oreades]